VTGIRYWLTAVMVLFGLGLAGAAVAHWREWPIYPVVGGAVLAGGAGLILGILPPGRPRSSGTVFQRRHTEPLWPYLPGSERTQFTRLQMDAAVADERRGATYVGLAMAAIIMGIGMAAVGVSVFAAARSEDFISAQVDRLTGLAGRTPEPTATPTAEPPTVTPTPDPPTATPTEEPPTATPSRTPTGRAGRTPSPTPPPNSQQQVHINLEGRWRVTDRVAFGQASGETFTFDIALDQEGDRVSGTGNGMSFQGRLDDEILTLVFTRPGGFGVFILRARNDGSFSGNWHDFTSQNGGTSTFVPVR
jgi:hypothetical protein